MASCSSSNRLRVNITIGQPLHQRLAEAAQERGRDRSQLIEEALELYLSLPYPPPPLEELQPALRLLIARTVEDYLSARQESGS